LEEKKADIAVKINSIKAAGVQAKIDSLKIELEALS
jgi:hypothetical protein